MNMLLKYKLLMFIVVLHLCAPSLASGCKEWEHSRLSIGVNNNGAYQPGGHNKVFPFVYWEESSGVFAVWQNNIYISGSIKSQSLEEYFGDVKNTKLALLNALGSLGWEAYSFQTNPYGDNGVLTDWGLKRCVKYIDQ